MYKWIGILCFFFSVQVFAIETDCFAPKSIDSTCLMVLPDVKFLDFDLSSSQVLVEAKTNTAANTDVKSTGKRIVFYDLNKAYTIQISKMNRASEGEIMTLSISDERATDNVNQKIQNSSMKNYYLANKAVTTSTSDASFLRTKIDRTRFDAKSLYENKDSISNQLKTASFNGSKETLPDGTEIIGFNYGGLNIDMQNGWTLKTLATTGTNKETKATLFQNLLGQKVQDAISHFVIRHVEVLQMHKNLLECRRTSGACPQLEVEYAHADQQRDELFLNMIKAEDMKIAPVPVAAPAPQPAPRVEYQQRCPTVSPIKTQFPNQYFPFYYYYGMQGCVIVYCQ